MRTKLRTQPPLALLLLAVFVPLGTTAAQESAAQGSQVSKRSQPPTADAQLTVTNQTSTAPGEIEELRKEVQDLRALVLQQQQTLAKIEQKLETNSPNATGGDSLAVRTTPVSLAVDAGNTDDREEATPAPAISQPKAPKEAPLLAGWNGQHFFLRSADGNFEATLGGYAQVDFRGFQHGNHPPNTFLIRRARLGLEGKLLREFDFKIEGDFADTTSTLLRDFWIKFHRNDALVLSFGQFRVPYSQEEIRRDAEQDFVERSLVNNLAPSRSPGIMISGVLHKGVLEYQLGAFNGKGLLALNTVGTTETTGRLRFKPWNNSGDKWTKGFAFGGTYSLGRNAINGTSVRGLTESRSFTFFTPETVNGPIIRANGEFTWTVGPAALRGEYDQVNQFRNRLGPHGTNLPGLVAKGYMGQFTYLLTGENKSDSGSVTPKHPVLGNEKGGRALGAWELKFRYSSLQLADGTAKSNRAQTLYTGVNWYLTNYVRYVFDLGFERFRNPLLTPNPGDRNFFVMLSRVQVMW